MSKPARGTKRLCPGCGARFYDLGRTPVACPACQAAYQVTPPPRRAERAQPEPEPPKPKVVEEPDPPVMGGAEVISLEEAGEAEEAAVKDDEIVDIDDDEDNPASDDDQDTFLEQDEDGNDDVSDIVPDGPKQES
ncbi:MAG: TIGR02300 family protein [Methyloceanibacter sp.]|uniref:TIGR02300 family protein n=1 Tax=Methyloceanibacter sp. TaxID=1965321 RepID=UPI003564A49E